MSNFLAGIGMSLLPRTLWGGWEPKSTVYYRWGTQVSGLLEFLLFFLIAASRVGGVFALLIVMVFAPIRFLLDPVFFLLGYFMLEGALRFWSAFITEETLPSLPFWLAGRVHSRLAAKRREEEMGPRVVDAVEVGTGTDYNLRIASCRPKAGWQDKFLTIAYQEQFYEVVREERAARPRPYVYFLRKATTTRLIRGLHHYRPDEALRDRE